MAAIDNEVPQQIFTVSVITAAIFCRLHGREFAPPKPEYSYIENSLHMMRVVNNETGLPDPRVREPPQQPRVPVFGSEVLSLC